MPRFLVLSEPNDPRQGVFSIEAKNRPIARQRVMQRAEGDVIWSTTQPQLNEELLRSFGPTARIRTREHIKQLLPSPTSGSIMQQESFLTRAGRTAREIGKPAIAPTALSFGGGMVSPLFGVPAPIGAALGGMGGELINQVLDITEDDLQQIVLAGATGAAAKGASSVLPRIGPRVNVAGPVRRLPGSQGAFTQIAGQELRNQPGFIRLETSTILGDDTIDGLFDFALRQRGRTRIATPTLRQELQTGLAREGRGERLGVAFPRLRKLMQQSAQQVKRGGESLELRDLELLRKRVGARIGRMAVDDEQRNVLRGIYKSILDDLDASIAAGDPGAAALRTAVKVSRREFAARDLEDFLEQRIFGNPRADGLRPIAIGKLKREIDDIVAGRPSKTFSLFEGSLSMQEMDELQRVVDFWAANLDPLPPPSGVQFGSGPTVGAGAAGFLLGGGTEGAAAGVLTKGILTKALMSRSGRAALVDLISRRQPINLTELALLTLGNIGRQQAIAPRLLERFGPEKIESAR